MKKILTALLLCQLTILFSCKPKPADVGFDINSPELLHQNQEALNQVIIYDVFSPPVASRIYAYTSLAFYEAIRNAKPEYPSLTTQLHGFGKMPQPEAGKKYNFNLAAAQAFFSVAHKVVFSLDTLKRYEQKVLNAFKGSLSSDEYDRSVAFGDSVGAAIIRRSAADNYKVTRGMPKYQGSGETGRWEPTSPDYQEGMEPYWGTIKPLLMDSVGQCMPPPPPAYSTSKNSDFYKYALEVYNIQKTLTDSQMFSIKYWDDNPFVVEHSGHMMFANKKITPGGHWMGIAGIASQKAGVDIVQTSQAYALTSIGLLEAFIACWHAKYISDVIRPISYINHHIDDKWEPILQTPPFPEYPSGHSDVSAAASTILTGIYGDNFSFHDTSDKKYIGMEKSFSSFYEAANDAAMSRVYGGIHYMSGMKGGLEQGKMIGKMIMDKLVIKPGTVEATASK